MTQRERDELSLYCPHCGNTSVQRRLAVEPYTEVLYYRDNDEPREHEAHCSVAKCRTCSRILVYEVPDDFWDQAETPWGRLVHPKPTINLELVPEPIRNTYREATRVKKVSPAAFALLARKLLEQICHDKKVHEGNLAASLSRLVADGIIPSSLSEATRLIRLVGNAGAHDHEVQLTEPQVWAVDDFLKVLLEYLYIAPAKIDKFKATYRDFDK